MCFSIKPHMHTNTSMIKTNKSSYNMSHKTIIKSSCSYAMSLSLVHTDFYNPCGVGYSVLYLFLFSLLHTDFYNPCGWVYIHSLCSSYICSEISCKLFTLCSYHLINLCHISFFSNINSKSNIINSSFQ
jgi:hypothetical protein